MTVKPNFFDGGDYHCHSSYSGDGHDSPRSIIEAAIEKGLPSIGFSEHSFSEQDPECCIKKEKIDAYLAEIASLKDEYRGKINVFCGIEEDFTSGVYDRRFDYAIGSLHYMNPFDSVKDAWIPIDASAELQREAAEKWYGGDIYAFCERYYELEAKVIAVTGADFIGHFDLVSKFNEKERIFDPQEPRYIKAWTAAADALLKTGRPFEVNTGAISRGYRITPYPSEDIYSYLKAHGASFILSGDSHRKENVAFKFEDFKDMRVSQ